jgi:hypothetical protein
MEYTSRLPVLSGRAIYFSVAVLVALGLTIQGEFRRSPASEDSHITLKMHVLTDQGGCWRECRDGLKGRCSTTELRPYLLIISYIEKS